MWTPQFNQYPRYPTQHSHLWNQRSNPPTPRWSATVITSPRPPAIDGTPMTDEQLKALEEEQARLVERLTSPAVSAAPEEAGSSFPFPSVNILRYDPLDRSDSPDALGIFRNPMADTDSRMADRSQTPSDDQHQRLEISESSTPAPPPSEDWSDEVVYHNYVSPYADVYGPDGLASFPPVRTGSAVHIPVSRDTAWSTLGHSGCHDDNEWSRVNLHQPESTADNFAPEEPDKSARELNTGLLEVGDTHMRSPNLAYHGHTPTQTPQLGWGLLEAAGNSSLPHQSLPIQPETQRSRSLAGVASDSGNTIADAGSTVPLESRREES